MKYLSLLKNFSNKKKILVVAIVFVLGSLGLNVSQKDVSNVVDMLPIESLENNQIKPEFDKVSTISPQRRVHILHGDATGGGHIYGAGKPCKSEFPQNWNENKIIEEVELIASNDNLNWEKQRNGYHVAETNRDGVKIRVVKGRENKQVITAYPLNTGRNPCPANDR